MSLINDPRRAAFFFLVSSGQTVRFFTQDVADAASSSANKPSAIRGVDQHEISIPCLWATAVRNESCAAFNEGAAHPTFLLVNDCAAEASLRSFDSVILDLVRNAEFVTPRFEPPS